ncbi:MAG TPA: hypothetical protein VD884_09395 [Ohtaekwangia sp.]|nr:hypothetical protein [Ohtaekwangia sp.]
MWHQKQVKESEFGEMHINLTWDELHERFGFDLKTWKKKFSDYLMKHPGEPDMISAFFRFGNDRINPLLNEVLGRSSGYPTFNRLTTYVAKKH